MKARRRRFLRPYLRFLYYREGWAAGGEGIESTANERHRLSLSGAEEKSAAGKFVGLSRGEKDTEGSEGEREIESGSEWKRRRFPGGAVTFHSDDLSVISPLQLLRESIVW